MRDRRDFLKIFEKSSFYAVFIVEENGREDPIPIPALMDQVWL